MKLRERRRQKGVEEKVLIKDGNLSLEWQKLMKIEGKRKGTAVDGSSLDGGPVDKDSVATPDDRLVAVLYRCTVHCRRRFNRNNRS